MLNLSHFFPDKVIGKNQHVVITIYGGAGSGKSQLAGGLIIGMANYMGRKLGRSPTDVFNFKDDFACINVDKVQAVIDEPHEYNILWFDDIATAINARRFANQVNIDFNDILQTFRPDKNIMVITTQYDFLIDKVPRKLAHYHIEMTDKLFDQLDVPLAGCKVSEIVVKHRQNKTWYPFISNSTGKYVRYINYKVPQTFMETYEGLRAAEHKRMRQLKKEAHEPKEKAPTKKEEILQIRRDIAAGVYGEYRKGLFTEICKMKGINPQYANTVS